MDVAFWVWLSVIVVAVVVEMITLDLISVWFAIGAVPPFIMSCFNGTPLWLEIVIFVVASGLLIGFLRKVAMKTLYKNSEGKTNTETFKGQTRKLLEDITFEKPGAVRFNGVVWTAVTENGQEIKAGCYVDVLQVQGNKLIVKLSDKQPAQVTVEQPNEQPKKVEEKKEEVKTETNDEPIVEEKGE